jgi:lysophospholipase L1-like esterase
MADQKFAYGKAKCLRKNTFKRTGYAFLGWAKSAKATKATYKNRKKVKNLSTTGGIVILYAVWNKLGKKNVVLCPGDSITKGIRCEGLPYPTRLANLCGRKVVNYGNGGKTSAYGAGIAESALIQEGPGTVCILFGANDATQNAYHLDVKENLRTIISLCRKYKATPVIATPTPQIWDHARYNANVKLLAADVRALGREERITVVDLNLAFGNGKKYLNPLDGLHLSDAGGDLMANMFYEAIR